MHETHDLQPAHRVEDREYFRLLGYPAGHGPGERAAELVAWAREWYAVHGRPWVYLRRVPLEVSDDVLRLDQVEFPAPQLRNHLRQHSAGGAVLLAVSAGREAEEHAHRLWNEGRPDEYFFLEMYASAVVEDLVARTSGRLCAEVGPAGLMAVPHYSPGYTGWEVSAQNQLFDVIARGMSRPFPGPLEVLRSGMLRPKKSLLAVFGLAPTLNRPPSVPAATPCANCAFSPCHYRRAAYRHQGNGAPEAARPPAGDAFGNTAGPLTLDGRYATSPRALRKWAAERVILETAQGGGVEATFRFDGTTCSNLGRPLAFDYRVRLAGPDERYRILAMTCRPAPGDLGYQATCAYLSDPDKLLRDLATEKPLLGQPLDDVLAWQRSAAPTGCHCAADSRAHKWGLALEAIHYALIQTRTAQPVS
jgi:hypothetical protein